ncbi:MAG: hypothetical protein ACM3VS_04645 [Candidatus Dadabacteria bacterium]
MIKILFLLIGLIGFAQLNAQTDSTTASNQPLLKLSVNYNTSLNYYGRTDSLKSTGLFPLAELWLTKDFYINAAPIFVNNKQQSFQYAGTVANLGLQHSTDSWITSLYALKPFYKDNSGLVQSALKAQGGFSITNLNKVVNLTCGADVKFSDNTDFGATAGLDHTFRIENKDNSVIVIAPSAYLYAGTQRFQQTYYKKTPGLLGLGSTNKEVSENVNKFNTLAYEFSAPLVYAKGNWMAIVTPSYILPQNLITVANRPDLSERGENMFYSTINLKYTIK